MSTCGAARRTGVRMSTAPLEAMCTATAAASSSSGGSSTMTTSPDPNGKREPSGRPPAVVAGCSTAATRPDLPSFGTPAVPWAVCDRRNRYVRIEDLAWTWPHRASAGRMRAAAGSCRWRSPPGRLAAAAGSPRITLGTRGNILTGGGVGRRARDLVRRSPRITPGGIRRRTRPRRPPGSPRGDTRRPGWSGASPLCPSLRLCAAPRGRRRGWGRQRGIRIRTSRRAAGPSARDPDVPPGRGAVSAGSGRPAGPSARCRRTP